MKPYYSDDTVTLYHGDCRDVLRGLTWDACITDPPYGVDLGNTGDPRGGSHGLNLSGYAFADTYEHFVREIVPRLSEALDRSRRAVVFTGPHIHEQKKPDAIGGIYCPGACARNGWGFKTFLPVLLYGKSPTVAMGKGATIPTTLRSSIATERHPNGHPVPKPLGG